MWFDVFLFFVLYSLIVVPIIQVRAITKYRRALAEKVHREYILLPRTAPLMVRNSAEVREIAKSFVVPGWWRTRVNPLD